jgi:mono/diheme cytochrome c family protein
MRVQAFNLVKSAGVVGALLFLLAASVSTAGYAQSAQSNARAANHASENQSSEARGKYIVEDLVICGQCHTPRDASGSPDRSRWLQGAPVWLKSAEPAENWPLQAPRIAGALPGTDEEMVTLLTTGIWRTGTYLRSPMPQFRMSRQDAESVVAYLKTVQPAAK